MHGLKLAFFVAFFLLGMNAFAEPPEAEGSILSVEPYRLIVASGEKSGTLSVSNKSGGKHSYNLELVDQVMDEKGITQRRETFAYSAKGMVRFTPKHFSIGPGEKQMVRILVTRPEGLADGDYHSHLLFRAEGSGEEDISGIAVPVVIRQGQTSSGIRVSGGKISGGEKKKLTLSLTRSGNAEAFARVSADYIREGEKPVTVLEPQVICLYREVNEVSKDFSLTNIPEEGKGGKLAVSLAPEENKDAPPAVTYFDFR